MKNVGERYNTPRPRHGGDVVILLGALLSIFAILGGAALAAWSLSADDARYADTVTSQNVSLTY